MSAHIDEAQVRHVAKLARLNLSDQEVRLFTGQLATILEHFRQLEQVDTEGVAPLAHPLSPAGVTRADEPQPALNPESALANAPARAGDLFRVPPILDQPMS